MAAVAQPSVVAQPFRAAWAAIWTLAALAACSSTAQPAAVSPGDACAHCRMAVSDVRFAGQVVAPGEEPLFYDDLGCLMRALAGGEPADRAFVADHRTREWVPATRAVFTRVPGLSTPMGSHLVAHASEESRHADPIAATGEALSFAEVLRASEPRAANHEPRDPHAH